jgi:hypothetical protein
VKSFPLDRRILAVLLLLTGAAARAAADERAAAEPVAAPDTAPASGAPAGTPHLADILEASGIQLTGYVDGTYEYLTTSGEFKGGTPSRVFDFRDNSFDVHQAALTVAMQPKQGFGAVVNLTAGTDAQVIKSYPYTGGADFDVTQAFVQYAHGPLTVMGGKFVTLANVEVIAETQDTNFSRSILFGYAVPFTNTGIRAIYALGDRYSVTLGVNNGWDQITDANGDKTLEVGLGWTPSKAFSILLNVYLGDEPINYTSRDVNTQRALVDAIVTWSATERLTLIANYDGARQSAAAADGGTARWSGIAGYVNYQWTDQWRSSLRAERFDDPEGYRTGVDTPTPGVPMSTIGQIWSELTLTAGFSPTKHFELRLEARADQSNVAAFLKQGSADGSDAALTKNQESLAAQAIFKF